MSSCPSEARPPANAGGLDRAMPPKPLLYNGDSAPAVCGE